MHFSRMGVRVRPPDSRRDQKSRPFRVYSGSPRRGKQRGRSRGAAWRLKMGFRGSLECFWEQKRPIWRGEGGSPNLKRGLIYFHSGHAHRFGGPLAAQIAWQHIPDSWFHIPLSNKQATLRWLGYQNLTVITPNLKSPRPAPQVLLSAPPPKE